MKNLNYQHIKIAILWLLIAVCYSLHSIFHLSALFFGADIKLPNANGTVPVDAHIFRIVVEVLTFLFVILSLYLLNKTYYWMSFIWAILLGVLNVVHLYETVTKDWHDLSQVALLTFIVVANIFLVRELSCLVKPLQKQIS